AGELVLECLKSGCKRILLTLGGSATNDGGCGLFCALGARFLRKNGEAFVPTGLTLEEIDSIDISGVAGAFFSCFFTVAADVKNTLLGEAGATYTYAPQKGALPGDLEKMERGMEHYASLLFRESGVRVAELPSSGAAGGMAAPVMAFGRCEVRSGAEAVLSAKGFYSEAKDADLVLTGEGSLDGQSLYGKTAGAAADFCRKENIPIYAVCGAFKDSEGLRERFAKILTVEALAENRDDSVKNASRYLEALGALAAIDVMSGAVKTEGRDAQ
ncbi:MAG: glycerate kinase, partial [Abditibacteriota bacterium]|nr:glycerate kinase [Abditibacteriota bacterium]